MAGLDDDLGGEVAIATEVDAAEPTGRGLLIVKALWRAWGTVDSSRATAAA